MSPQCSSYCVEHPTGPTPIPMVTPLWQPVLLAWLSLRRNTGNVLGTEPCFHLGQRLRKWEGAFVQIINARCCHINSPTRPSGAYFKHGLFKPSFLKHGLVIVKRREPLHLWALTPHRHRENKGKSPACTVAYQLSRSMTSPRSKTSTLQGTTRTVKEVTVLALSQQDISHCRWKAI